MTRFFLRSKIHRATVTEANVEYEGSITIDRELLEVAGIRPYEKVEVYNVTQGTRLATYAIEGEAGRGDIRLNGAAAHPAHVGAATASSRSTSSTTTGRRSSSSERETGSSRSSTPRPR